VRLALTLIVAPHQHILQQLPKHVAGHVSTSASEMLGVLDEAFG